MRELKKEIFKSIGIVVTSATIGVLIANKISKLLNKYDYIFKFTNKDITYSDELNDSSIGVICSSLKIDASQLLENENSLNIFSTGGIVEVYVPCDFDVCLEGKSVMGDIQIELEEDIEKDKLINIYYDINFSKLVIYSI
jgi:predicted membrane protein